MQPRAPGARKPQTTITIAIAVATASAWAAVASAATGGGGVGTPDPPRLTDVLCLEQCADIRAATVGSRVELTGRNLTDVSEVRFSATGGRRVEAEPESTTARTVEVEVPEHARSGSILVSAYGASAQTPQKARLKIVDADQIPDAGQFRLTSAEAAPRRSFFDGRRMPSVSYVFQGKRETDVRIEVVDRKRRRTVDTFIQRDAKPGARNSARWDGRTLGGRLVSGGDFEFRVGSAAAGGATSTADSRFSYHSYRFPLATRHSYGDGYGAGRGHEGQDVFAKCGAPILAARGGRVQRVDVHPAAGNYVVIDGRATGVDTFYAHLLARSPLRRGQRVHTGQVIGRVGKTGDASACHLHFEIWSAPGWYEGGSAMASVGRLLHTWDRWS